jgi:hypothetical protein
MLVRVKMTRGGYVNLEVEGRTYTSKDGAGQTWAEVEIDSVCWPGGRKVADKNIADWRQLKSAYLEAL